MNKKNQIGKVFWSMWIPRSTTCSLHERQWYISPVRETSEASGLQKSCCVYRAEGSIQDVFEAYLA